MLFTEKIFLWKMTEGHLKYDVVIDLTEFAVCCEPAIKSILRYPTLFAALHLVQPGFSTTATLYDQWKVHLGRLKTLGLEPIWHSELNADKLKTRAVIHMQPDHQVRDGALEALLQDMHDNNKWNSHFGVSSITKLDHAVPGVIFYGFLLVLGVFDSLRSFFNGFRYHRTADLRGQATYITFPATVTLASMRWWTWLLFTRVSPIQKGGAALMQIPSKKDSGLDFVLRTLKTHNHLGFGLWILFFVVYYALFAWPWWSSFFAVFKIPIVSRMLPFILEREPPGYWLFEVYVLGRVGVHVSTLAQTIQLLHLAAVGMVTYMYFELPMNSAAAFILLYPFYLAAFPLLYVLSYFHTSRAAWTVEEEEEDEHED